MKNRFVFTSFYMLITLQDLFEFQVYAQKATKNPWTNLALKMHNVVRKKHGAKKLKLSETLCTYATHCALDYVNRLNLDHSCKYADGFGQNLYMSVRKKGEDEEDFIEEMIDSWYFNEEEKYVYHANPDENESMEEFTQMVWQESTRFGFAIAEKKGFRVGVALYYPKGNKEGEYEENVIDPEDVTTKKPWFPGFKKPIFGGSKDKDKDKEKEKDNEKDKGEHEVADGH